MMYVFFFFQAEDGIRDLVRSRGLGDVYKRQPLWRLWIVFCQLCHFDQAQANDKITRTSDQKENTCLLYTSDAADERSSVDLGGRRIIKKKNNNTNVGRRSINTKDVDVITQ